MNPKKNRLQRILAALSPDGTEVDFSAFDKAIEDLKSGLKEKVQAKTLEDVNNKLDMLRKSMNLAPLQEALKGVETGVDARIKEIQDTLESELDSFRETSRSGTEQSQQSLLTFAQDIQSLRDELTSLDSLKSADIGDIKSRLYQLPELAQSVENRFREIKTTISNLPKDETKADKEALDKLVEELEKMRLELLNRINNIPRGGGANRNIAIGGNTSVLSKYTDINIKAGSNVTLTYQNNETTKYLDLTIAATGGGGGSVTGITRAINNTSVSLIADATPGIDEVYVCAAGVKITLPTASLNGNLYTIKNVSTSSVLVARDGTDTIDNDTSLILATQFTAVDLISDGFSNWNIT